MTKQAIVPRDTLVVSGVAGEDGSPAKMLPEIESGYGHYDIHHRTTANSLLNEDIVKAIHATGRKTILISGVATELAVQLPAVTAAEHGLRALVVLDACGGTSERTEQAALSRIAHAGGSAVSVLKLARELAGISARRWRSRRSASSSRWPQVDPGYDQRRYAVKILAIINEVDTCHRAGLLQGVCAANSSFARAMADIAFGQPA